jgi:hypothetical protein
MQPLLDQPRRRGAGNLVVTGLALALLLVAIGGVDAALRLRHQQERASLRQQLDALALPAAVRPTSTSLTSKSLCPPGDCRGLQREYDSDLTVPATYQAFLAAFDQAGYRFEQPQDRGCGGLRLAAGLVNAAGSLRGCRATTSDPGSGDPLLTLVVGQTGQGTTLAVVTIGAAS